MSMNDKVIKFKKEDLLPVLYPFLVRNGEETYVRHILSWSNYPVYPFEKSENNTHVNDEYRGKKEEYDEYMDQKDYESVMVLLNKQTRIWWFIQNYKKVYKDLGEEKYYEILSENLTYVDNHDQVRKYYSKMISLGSNPHLMMSKKERKQFEKLPETFTIYRGTSSNTKPNSTNIKKLLGNSWTNDKKISEWFSQNHSPKYRGSKYIILLNYQVKKSEIISYFTERNEKEIFLDYTKIDISMVKWEIIQQRTNLVNELG